MVDYKARNRHEGPHSFDYTKGLANGETLVSKEKTFYFSSPFKGLEIMYHTYIIRVFFGRCKADFVLRLLLMHEN